MPWTCAQIEERLSDFLDGTLAPKEEREFSAHAGACPRCSQLIGSVSSVVGRMRTMETLEMPPDLIVRILDQTLGPRAEFRGWRRWLGWFQPVWQPRFAMGTVSVLATFFILFQAFGMSQAKLKRADLSPANLYHSVNRQAHLAYARGAKFVNDLRVVYEIQSRLRPEAAPPPAPEEPSAPSSPNPQQKSQGRTNPGRSANRNASLLAFALMGQPGRNSR